MLKPITLFGSIIIFAIALTIMILAIVSYTSVRFDTLILNDITSNWKKSPIFDIKVRDYSCKIDFPFIQNGWAGTVEGCDCTNAYFKSIIHVEKLSRRSCGYNDTTLGCDSVSASEEINYSTWKGGKMCATKKPLDYGNYSLLAYHSNNDFNNTKTDNFISDNNMGCPKNTKPCGVLDTLNNILCLGTKEECPINKIIIKQNDDVSDLTDFNYKKVSLGNNHTLYYTNENTNGNIFVDIIASDYNICSNFLEKEQFNPYLLDKNTFNECNDWMKNGKIHDERYQIIDSYSKINVYSENGISNIINRLPYYNDYINSNTNNTLKNNDNSQIKLYSRNYLGWKRKCSSDSEYQVSIVNDIITRLNSAIKLHYVIMVMANACFAIAVLANIVTCVSKSGGSALAVTLQGLYSIGCFMLCICCFFGLKNMLSISLNAKEIVLNECGDDITNSIFEIIFQNTHRFDNQTILILAFVGCFLFPFIYLVNFLERKSAQGNMIETE